MNRADRRKHMRRALVVFCVALLLLGIGLGAVALRQQATAPRAIADGCPAVMPGTDTAHEDLADMFVWRGRTYINTDIGVKPVRPVPDASRPGAEVGRVTCSLSEPPMSTVGQRVVSTPWPDGTATALTHGTPIYAVPGVPTDCLLAARRDGTLGTYVAIDTSNVSWPPLC